MKPFISAIVLVYHDEKYLKQCVETLRRSTQTANLTLEVVIVVNDTNLKITNFQFPNHCKIIFNKKNLGFGRSINKAAKIAKGEWLFLLNVDTLIDKYSLKNLIIHTKKNSVAIIAPKIIRSDNQLQYSILEEPTFWNILKEQSYLYRLFPTLIFSPQVDDTLYKNTNKVQFITAISFLIRKSVFQKLKGFDERFFIYFEDIDLCKRITATSYSILYEPRAKITHYLHQSFGGTTNGKYYIQSLYKYLAKYHSKLYALLGITFLALGCLARLIYWSMRKLHTKDQNTKDFAIKKIYYCNLIIGNYFKILSYIV